MAWRAVLEGDDAARARRFVEDAAAELTRREVADASLGFGAAGIALLHGYRARDGVDGAADQCFDALARALELTASDPRPWLFHGYAGVGFVMHHLADVVGDTGDTLAELDALVDQQLAVENWPYAWELTAGVVGLGVYALERGLPALVERAVHHLAAGGERVPAGLTWRSNNPDHADGYHNLGIAHGVAGVIAFLAEVRDVPRAHDVMRDAVSWLLSRARPEAVPTFPMTEGRAPPRDVILDGWCYGEPSTALVLLRAGEAANEPRWIESAHELALVSARRTREQLATMSIDTTLCHGSIGRAHLFHRLGVALGDDELLVAARGWYRETVASARLDLEVPGLQLGLAGVALGLIGGYATVAPDWDVSFLSR